MNIVSLPNKSFMEQESRPNQPPSGDEMDLIKISAPSVSLQSEFYGHVPLERDRTYLLHTAHIDRLEALGLGHRTDDYDRLAHLERHHLRHHTHPARMILLFDGGLGDAISLAALLEGIKKTFNIAADVACRYQVWECILKPLGFKGGCRRPPLHTNQLYEYDYIQTKADRFFLQERQRWAQCILEELERAYKVDLKHHRLTYAIPADALERSYLPETARVRIGVNFDSQGDIRSYPRDLQPLLLELLLQADTEVFLFGQRQQNLADLSKNERLHDLRGGTSIFELAALVNQMDIILGVDSFIAHLANVLEIRTLVMLTVTRKGVFSRHQNVSCLESLIECAPCGRVGNRCPLGYARCRAFFHDSLTPERIARAVLQECARHFKRMIEQRARSTTPSKTARG